MKKHIRRRNRNRKRRNPPALAVFVCMLMLAAAASIFAEENTFTAMSSFEYLICTYEVITEPTEDKPGTVALIHCERNQNKQDANWESDNWDIDLSRGITSSDGEKKYNVVRIGDGKNPIFPSNGDLNRIYHVSMPDTLESIEPYAFHDFAIMSSISGLADNENVKIAESAFYGCFLLDEECLPPSGTENNPDPFGPTVIEDFLELRGYRYNVPNYYESNVCVRVSLPVNEYNNPFSSLNVRRLFAGYDQDLVLVMYSNYFAETRYYKPVNLSVVPAESVTSFDSANYNMDVVIDESSSEDEEDMIFRLKKDGLDDYPVDGPPEPWDSSEYVFAFNCKDIDPGNVIFAVSSHEEQYEGVAPTIESDIWIQKTIGVDEPFEIELEVLHTTEITDNATSIVLETQMIPEANKARIYSNGPLEEGTYSFRLFARNGWTYDYIDVNLIVGDGIPNQSLASPQVKWTVTQSDQETNAITANHVAWTRVISAGRYELKLYREGIEEPLLEETVIDPQYADKENKITNAMNEYGYGLYTITVTAVSDTPNYTPGEPGRAQYNYTAQAVAQYEGIVTTEGGGQVRLNTDQSSAGAESEETADSVKATVADGGTLAFDFIPAIGYELVSVKKDGTVELGKHRNCIIRDISADFALHAVFNLIHNRVDGVTPEGVYEKGKTLEITAIGHRMDAAVEDETRWIPKHWQVDENTETSWTGGPYTGRIDTSALSSGNHMLKVKFQQQQYDKDSGTWVDVMDAEEPSRAYEIKEIAFHVKDADKQDPPEEPTEPENPTKPEEPTEPENPTKPEEPTEPDDPADENDPQDEPTDSDKPADSDESTDSDDTSTGEKDPQEPSKDDADGSKEDADDTGKEEGSETDHTDGDGEEPGAADRTDGGTSGRAETEDAGMEEIVNSITNIVRTADPMKLTIWFAAFAVSASFLLSSVAGRGRRSRKGEPPVDCHRLPRR